VIVAFRRQAGVNAHVIGILISERECRRHPR
jgi:hypothetical protein